MNKQEHLAACSQFKGISVVRPAKGTIKHLARLSKQYNVRLQMLIYTDRKGDPRLRLKIDGFYGVDPFAIDACKQEVAEIIKICEGLKLEL